MGGRHTPFARRLCVWLPVAPLSGCMVLSGNPEYPAERAPASEQRLGNCTLIAGRNLDEGEMHVTSRTVRA
jgi:hypothetical protein